MAKFQSPLLGYNNNVRHKNRVFHIQTEDSGVSHPHIITHLFMDGGRILKSVKTSYAEHVGTDAMKETVRGMMKEQHKAMFIALRDGQYDHIVDPGAAAAAAAASATATAAAAAAPVAAAAPAPEPAVAAAGPSGDPPVSDALASTNVPVVPAVAASEPELAVAAPVPSNGPTTNPEPPRVDLDLPPNTIDESKRPAASVRPAPAPAEDVPMTTRQPEPRMEPPPPRPGSAASALKAASPPRATSPSGRELTLDFDALERAAQETGAPSASLFNTSDLPPPPKNLFASKEAGSGGIYRAVEADARGDSREESKGRNDPREEPANADRHGSTRSQPASRREESPQPSRTAPRSNSPAPRPPSDARYAPARPAAIFGSTQRPQPQSLFSDELVSDKSLDEVILSYLAEDLEPPRRK
jgi:hypothetical protein